MQGLERTVLEVRRGNLSARAPLDSTRDPLLQEFTVTLRNGNSAEYRHLLVAFQMEFLVGEPGGVRRGGLVHGQDQPGRTGRR